MGRLWPEASGVLSSADESCGGGSACSDAGDRNYHNKSTMLGLGFNKKKIQKFLKMSVLLGENSGVIPLTQ